VEFGEVRVSQAKSRCSDQLVAGDNVLELARAASRGRSLSDGI